MYMQISLHLFRSLSMELCQPQSLENESMENVALPTQILTEMSEVAVNSSLLPNNSNIGDLNLNLICAAVSPKSSSSDNSMSGKSEGESEKNKTTALLVGKRRRSQPIKFQPSPITKRLPFKLRTPRTLPPRKTTSTDDLTPVIKRKRGARCGNCPGCVREDCGKCDFCKDKPKFGGPGKKKQRCKLRTCSNFQHKKAGFYDLRKVICYFKWHLFRLGGAFFVLGGAFFVLGGAFFVLGGYFVLKGAFLF